MWAQVKWAPYLSWSFPGDDTFLCVHIWGGEGKGVEFSCFSEIVEWGMLSAGLELPSLSSVAERLVKPTSGW